MGSMDYLITPIELANKKKSIHFTIGCNEKI